MLALMSVLEQEQEDGKLCPVAYASRSLSKAEQNYGITEMEALGVVWGAKHFRAYLYGHQYIVYNDHSPLKSMLKAQHPSRKLVRWAQSLCEFDLELHLRPGRVNSNADALSRAPVGSSIMQDDGTEVQVAQVSGTCTVDDMGELKALQEGDVEVRQIVRYLQDGIVPEDLKYVMMEKDTFVVLDGLCTCTMSTL